MWRFAGGILEDFEDLGLCDADAIYENCSRVERYNGVQASGNSASAGAPACGGCGGASEAASREWRLRILFGTVSIIAIPSTL